MRMLSKIAIAALTFLAATAPAVAETAAKQRFVHEGYIYVYQVKDTAQGQVISGRRYPDATAFNLSVKDGKVQGVSGGQTVAFNVAEAKGAAGKVASAE